MFKEQNLLEAKKPSTNRDNLRSSIDEFQKARPGKRAAALSTLWVALTGSWADIHRFDIEDSLPTYVSAGSELRARTRMYLVRAVDNEPDVETRNKMIQMLRKLDDLEFQIIHHPKKSKRGSK